MGIINLRMYVDNFVLIHSSATKAQVEIDRLDSLFAKYGCKTHEHSDDVTSFDFLGWDYNLRVKGKWPLCLKTKEPTTFALPFQSTPIAPDL